MPKKYVILRGITPKNMGVKFWAKNSENPTVSKTGEVWYEVVKETDSEQEAMDECWPPCGRFL